MDSRRLPAIGVAVILAAALAACGGASRQADLAVDVPGDAPGEAGGDLPSDPAPGDEGRDVPADPAADPGADLPGDAPDEAPSDLHPADIEDSLTPPDVPADAPADLSPGDAVPDAASDLPGDTPDDGAWPPPCPEFGKVQVLGTITSADLREVSGLAASRRQPGVLWAHNDSGDSARIFAVRTDGSVAGEFRLKGIGAVDFEDLSTGPFAGLDTDAIFIADVGDNGRTRSKVVVHVLEEPDVPSGGDPIEVPVLASIALAYPGGAADCEAFFVDPATGDFYLAAKETLQDGTCRLFRKSAPHVASTTPVLLEEVAHVPTLPPTGADMSADGSMLIVRTYFGGVLYFRAPGQSIAQAVAAEPCELPPFPNEPQGEAIAIDPDGSGFVTVSEYRSGTPQDLHRTPLQ